MESFCPFIQKEQLPCVLKLNDVFKHMKLSMLCPDSLKDEFLEPLKFRVGKRDSSGVQWEGNCHYVHATVKEFLLWNKIPKCDRASEKNALQDQFRACCRSHFWCYADYMYMKDIFKDRPDILSALDWSLLGFADKDGNDTTMWMGSEGSHTVCHYDQYGFNIVIQVSGAKRWTLFAPQDSDALYQTRIPYEESSVFSEVNIRNPDLQKHPRFLNSKPCTVVLRPGDMLYVPHHWWHFVENLELSVSVNLWYEMEADKGCRLEESVTRLLIGTCFHTKLGSQMWINPTEDVDSVQSIQEGLNYLNQSVSSITETSSERSFEEVGEKDGKEKNEKLETGGKKETRNFINIGEVEFERLLPTLIKDLSAESTRKRKRDSGDSQSIVKRERNTDLSYADFVKCLTHGDVIKTISRIILDKQRSSSI